MNLLVVEDDQTLGRALSRGLEEAGHNCRWVRSGQKGLEAATSQKFDAVVLDLMLPDLPGMEVMRGIRQAGIRTPLPFLRKQAHPSGGVLTLRCGQS